MVIWCPCGYIHTTLYATTMYAICIYQQSCAHIHYVSVSSKCGYINMYLFAVMRVYQYICMSSACGYIQMYPCAVNMGISICICEQCMWVQEGYSLVKYPGDESDALKHRFLMKAIHGREFCEMVGRGLWFHQSIIPLVHTKFRWIIGT